MSEIFLNKDLIVTPTATWNLTMRTHTMVTMQAMIPLMMRASCLSNTTLLKQRALMSLRFDRSGTVMALRRNR